MRPEQLSIESLQAFVAVVDTGAFSAAAERLHLTQPAISKRIQSLEASLQRPLFERQGRRVRPTEVAVRLLPEAREILARLHAIEQQVADLDQVVRGRIRLATSHHIALHRLPAPLAALRTRYPELELELAFMDSEAGIEAVMHGDADLALATLPNDLPKGSEAQPVWTDDLVPMIARGRAQDAPLDTLQRLHDWPAILPPVGSTTRRQIDHALAALGLHTAAAQESPYLEVIRMMIAAGLGIGFLPRTMATDELAILEWPAPPITRQLGWVRHADRYRSRTLAAVIEGLHNGEDQKPLDLTDLQA
ncbi:LysR family transcriptional regulator [Thioalkalivibrio sp. ALJT]|uniref:LysR family transcriptional regulator n=1 Tax=Thioalkalivibrio sp. ALJT TaxID=1158146 RepID=UPI000376D8A1|nr:LysR family transcriptional regulator [Thioalkalivibrio sp. ALJT]